MTTLMAGHWFSVTDKDHRARGLYARHYSAEANRNKPRQSSFHAPGYVGTGDYLAFLTVDCTALFVWKRYPDGIDRGGQIGVNCSIFRNESSTRSSDLIQEACELAWSRWPGQRLYTYVNPGKIRSTNPGYCFKRAGFRKCGMSKGGLVILERLP
jgi:hypothetical protein